ncbi:MAG TPA: TonB-dependent hemoglobin/transferrin/lactoferrin family receptor [Thermoanaerobaculia bacterium]|jgi:hemoglobin/transferrin/lactoferrin receptor protein|nr:TonB-dependent hemoglobin/transferrin/lactoferrin family receptor [Thermoanaerobaculia bacterium]
MQVSPRLALFLVAFSTMQSVFAATSDPPAESREPATAEAATADAEPPTFLDAITVTATRSPKSVKDAPGSVSVIDAARIEREMAADARDLVRFEPGVYVEGDVTRLGLSGFNIRGVGGNRVLTQVDGIPTAEQFSFGPLSVPQTFLDLDAVSSVEIVRSAASSLYGSDALGGVVSVVTKDPRDLLDGGRSAFRLRAGYDGRDREVSESLTGAFGSQRWDGSLLVSRRDGEEMDNQGTVETANSSRTAPNPADREGTQALGKVVFRPSGSLTWRLGLERYAGRTDTAVLSSQGLVDMSAGFPPGAVFTIDTTNFDARDEVDRSRLSLEQSLQRSGGLFDTLFWRLYGQDSESEQHTVERRVTTQGGSVLGPIRTTSVDRFGLLTFEQRRLGGEAQMMRYVEVRSVPVLFTYGASAGRDSFDQLRNRRDVNLATGATVPGALPFPTKYFPESEVTELGAYLQAELELAGGRLRLTPGLRFDRFDLDADQDDRIYRSGNPGTLPPADLSDAALSPKLSLVYAPKPSLAVFAQYARGFRAPPYSEVNNGFTNVASGYTTLANPDLRPETSDNYEVGVRAAMGKASLSFTVFDNRYEDFIETVTVGFNPATGLIEFQPRNVTEARIHGVEVAGDAALGSLLRLRGSFAWIEGENRTADVPLNTIPPARLVLGLQLRPSGSRFGAELVSTVAAGKDEDDLDTSAVRQFAAPSYEVFDLTAFMEITERLSVHAGVFNLLDETYWEWANVRGVAAASPVLDRYTSPGRAAAASLRWHW